MTWKFLKFSPEFHKCHMYFGLCLGGHFSSLIFLGQQEGIPLMFKFLSLGFLVFLYHCAVSLYSLHSQGLHPSLILPVSCCLRGCPVWENLSRAMVDLLLSSHPNLILLYINIYATWEQKFGHRGLQNYVVILEGHVLLVSSLVQ